MAVYRRNGKGREMEDAGAPDMVNHPPHYTYGRYECKDVIMDWGLPWTLGNAVKYICRCDHKGTPLEDLKKAIVYIQLEIDSREAKG